jgi:hypothetical protein
MGLAPTRGAPSESSLYDEMIESSQRSRSAAAKCTSDICDSGRPLLLAVTPVIIASRGRGDRPISTTTSRREQSLNQEPIR